MRRGRPAAFCATSFFSSADHHGRLLDDVAHEPAGVPVGRIWLRLAAAAGATDHQPLRSLRRWSKADLPLAEAVLAFILAELCLLPGLAAVAGEVHPRNSGIAAEGDPAREGGRTRLQRVALLDVCDEGTRRHPIDRHRLELGLTGPDIGAGCTGDTVGRC